MPRAGFVFLLTEALAGSRLCPRPTEHPLWEPRGRAAAAASAPGVS